MGVLRISGSRESGRLQLEGRLADQWVDELARVTGDGPHGQLTVDLSAVAFIDRRGVAFLRELCGSGAVLVGGSAFVQSLLRRPEHESCY